MGARWEESPESINGQKSSNFDLFLFLLFPFSIVYLLGDAIFLALKKPKKIADSEEPDYGQHDIVRASQTHMDEHPPFEGTDFQVKVWNALKEIPRGEVRTYKQIAVQIGHPNSARAVANACGQNPYPPIVPCHRVVRSDGGLGGYSGVGGVETKRRILSEEGVSIISSGSR